MILLFHFDNGTALNLDAVFTMQLKNKGTANQSLSVNSIMQGVHAQIKCSDEEWKELIRVTKGLPRKKPITEEEFEDAIKENGKKPARVGKLKRPST